jgi:hypothetical protein
MSQSICGICQMPYVPDANGLIHLPCPHCGAMSLICTAIYTSITTNRVAYWSPLASRESDEPLIGPDGAKQLQRWFDRG